MGRIGLLARDVRPQRGAWNGAATLPWGSMKNGGVIITDFINLRKGKIDEKLEGFSPRPQVVTAKA